MFQPRRTISEVELNTELDIARPSVSTQRAKIAVSNHKGRRACSRDTCGAAAVKPAGQVRIEPIIVRMVEEVEELCAKLNTITLANLPILGH